MLFNSLEFSVFLPIVFLFYWFAFGRSSKLQNTALLVASYVFYGWWDYRFLVLITFTGVCTWLTGLAIDRTRGGIGGKFGVPSLGFDFVFGDNDQPLLVEMSYGYDVHGYDPCPGYWTSDGTWHEESFVPQEWMVERVISRKRTMEG